MPQLLKKVQGEILTNTIGDVTFVTSVYGQIQGEDYINLNGFVAYLQNFSRVELAFELVTPMEFGLPNTYNIETKTLEISY
jgi:hypothetical protein